MELSFTMLCAGSLVIIFAFIIYTLIVGSRSLRNYLITRLLLAVPTVWLLVTLVFVIMRLLPGDPIQARFQPGQASPEKIAELREELGLNDPLHEQYLDYMNNILRGDFGESAETSRPVSEMIGDALPATMELVLPAVILVSIIGIYSGAFAASRHKSRTDYSLRVTGIVLYSLPVFWVGLMLQLIFGSRVLGLLPTSQRISAALRPEIERHTNLLLLDTAWTGNWEAFGDVLQHMILPTLTLSIALIGVFLRITRSNMIEVLQEDYISAARARGIPENRIIMRHALRNSLIPVMTLIGLQVAALIAGAVLTETTFSWPGMGLLIRDGIANRDYPPVQAAVTVFAIGVVLVNTLTDIIYAFIDPRIRY